MVAEDSKLITDLINSNRKTQKLIAELAKVLNEFTKIIKDKDGKVDVALEQNQKLALAMNDLVEQIKTQRIAS